MDRHNSAGVRETRVIHEVHRRASTLLTEVVAPPVPPEGAADFRDFVVAMLEHHHDSEDRDLWPLLVALAPHLERPLRALTGEHDQLQAGLDRLSAWPLPSGRLGGDEASRPSEARDLAVAVNALLHEHLAHEEPVLFPALDRHVTDKDWDGFSMRTVASTPQDGLPFLVALIHEVASPADAELIFRHVPEEGRASMAARRAEGDRAIAELRAAVTHHPAAAR